MKIAEQVAWLGQLHGLDRATARRNTEELLAQLDLEARANDKLEDLSLGNQQRVQVAAALVHDPVLLILDEPFSGLDPIAVGVVLGVLRERAKRGVPVLFSSHQLAIVEQLCDDLVILSGGTIAASGDREQLRREHGTERWELVVDSDAGWLRDLAGVRVVDLDGPRAVFELTGGTSDQDVLKAALGKGAVRSFTPVLPSLEEIFKEAI